MLRLSEVSKFSTFMDLWITRMFFFPLSLLLAAIIFSKLFFEFTPCIFHYISTILHRSSQSFCRVHLKGKRNWIVWVIRSSILINRIELIFYGLLTFCAFANSFVALYSKVIYTIYIIIYDSILLGIDILWSNFRYCLYACICIIL